MRYFSSATRLRKLAANCEFHDVNKEIKSAIIQNCQSKRLRRYALREEALSLDNLLAKARSLEVSETQATGMEKKLPLKYSQDEEISFVKHKLYRRGISSQPPSTSKTCRNCGLTWPHEAKPYPAKGQTCRKCGKLTHFAKVCLSTENYVYKPKRQGYRQEQKLNQVTVIPSDETSSSDDEYLYTTGQDRSKIPTVQMIVDTGASTDILDEETFNKVNQRNIVLHPTTKRLFAYGSTTQLYTLGQFDGEIGCNQRKQRKQSTQTTSVLSCAARKPWFPTQLQNSNGSRNS